MKALLLRGHLVELKALYERLEPEHTGRERMAARIKELEEDIRKHENREPK